MKKIQKNWLIAILIVAAMAIFVFGMRYAFDQREKEAKDFNIQTERKIVTELVKSNRGIKSVKFIEIVYQTPAGDVLRHLNYYYCVNGEEGKGQLYNQYVQNDGAIYGDIGPDEITDGQYLNKNMQRKKPLKNAKIDSVKISYCTKRDGYDKYNLFESR